MLIGITKHERCGFESHKAMVWWPPDIPEPNFWPVVRGKSSSGKTLMLNIGSFWVRFPNEGCSGTMTES